MPEIDELLNTELKEMSDDNVILIDVESRIIIVPESESLFGVESDKNSERKHFRCPRIVGNNLDIADANIYINYQNAGGAKDVYIVTDKTIQNEYVEFSWELYKNVTEYMGIINFIVCAKWSDSSGVIKNEWNTTVASGTSLQGLEADEQVKQDAKDILEQLLGMYKVNIKKELLYNKTNRTVTLEG